MFKRGTIFLKIAEKVEEDEVLKQLDDEDYVVNEEQSKVPAATEDNLQAKEKPIVEGKEETFLKT